MALVYKVHIQGGSDNTTPFTHNHLYIEMVPEAAAAGTVTNRLGGKNIPITSAPMPPPTVPAMALVPSLSCAFSASRLCFSASRKAASSDSLVALKLLYLYL